MKGDRDMRGKKELERQKPQEMKQRQAGRETVRRIQERQRLRKTESDLERSRDRRKSCIHSTDIY